MTHPGKVVSNNTKKCTCSNHCPVHQVGKTTCCHCGIHHEGMWLECGNCFRIRAVMEELREACPTSTIGAGRNGEDAYVLIRQSQWETFQNKISKLDALTPDQENKE